MKIKTSKLLAVLCTLAMMVATFVPMLTLSATAAEDGTWTLVTKVSDLAVGDHIVIVAANSNYALSTTQGNNNRGQASVTKSGNTITLGDDVQRLTLEAGKTSGTFAFNTGSGYLYAASSSKNYLRTETTLSDNSSWTISITADGVATIKAQGTNTRNWLRYNSASSLFSCYGSGQNDVAIYKLVSAATEPDVPTPSFTASFEVPKDMIAPDARDGSTVEMPSMDNPKGNFAHDYVFVGWMETQLDGDTTDKPNFYKAGDKVTLTKDTTFYAVYSYSAEGSGATSSAYQLTDISKITATDVVVITMTKGTTVYALSSANGTSKAPAGAVITVEGGKISAEIADDLKWNISNESGNLTIYPNGTTETWLYCTNTNNGVRVGTNDGKVFTIDATSGYLKHTGTSRYVGVYTTTPDWRCYDNTTGNTANQTLGFYVLSQSSTVTYYSVNLTINGCAHNDVEDVPAQEATCTESGYTAGKLCNDCGNYFEGHDIIPATGHQNTTKTTVDASCTVDGSITTTCDDCGATISTETLPAGHNFVDGVCTKCGEKLPDYSGRYYIATTRTEGTYWYMTRTIVSSRYQAVDSGLTELPASITEPADGYVFEIINNGDGTYLIKADGVEDDNYLGWTSGNSGILVAESNAKKFTIKLTDDGLFNIYFDTRYLSLNSTSGNDYFAFYAGTQKQNLALIPVVETPVEPEPPVEPETPAGEITGAQLILGTDLSLNYRITIAYGESYDSFKMVFTLGDKTVEAITSDGEFKLNGIAPHQMGDTVTATLYKGDVVIHTLDYSIKAYLDTIINGEGYDEKTVALAEALLIYGAAAQDHQDYKEDAFVTDKTPTVDDANQPESILKQYQESENIDGVSFRSVGVNFDYVNRLYITLTAADKNVTVKVNDKDAEIVDGRVLTDAIAPADFDEKYTFELYVDGVLYQTVEYSVDSYINAKWDTDLAKALYNYAAAVANYK